MEIDAGLLTCPVKTTIMYVEHSDSPGGSLYAGTDVSRLAGDDVSGEQPHNSNTSFSVRQDGSVDNLLD